MPRHILLLRYVMLCHWSDVYSQLEKATTLLVQQQTPKAVFAARKSTLQRQTGLLDWGLKLFPITTCRICSRQTCIRFPAKPLRRHYNVNAMSRIVMWRLSLAMTSSLRNSIQPPKTGCGGPCGRVINTTKQQRRRTNEQTNKNHAMLSA